MPWALIGWGVVAALVGKAVKDAGAGVEAAGSGGLKIAFVAGGAYLLARNVGLLK